MILVDTHVVLWDTLNPKELSSKAKKTLQQADASKGLYLSEWSLWEIALLMKKKRFDPGTSYLEFAQLVLDFRKYTVVGINAEIIHLSTDFPESMSKDPVDRILLATSLYHQCPLLSIDEKIHRCGLGKVIW